MKRTMFIGQAMPRIKRDPYDWPTLNNWLHSIEISDDQIKRNFLYSALVDYFPGAEKGSHIVPTKDDIGKERKRLIETFGSGTANIWFGIISWVLSNHQADSWFRTYPLLGIKSTTLSKADSRSVPTSANFFGISKMSLIFL